MIVMDYVMLVSLSLCFGKDLCSDRYCAGFRNSILLFLSLVDSVKEISL